MSLTLPPLARIRLSVVSHRARELAAEDKALLDLQLYLHDLLAEPPKPALPPHRQARLAPFRAIRPAIASFHSPALAVFDTMPVRARLSTTRPQLPAAL